MSKSASVNDLMFVTCVSNIEVLAQRLLASPCLKSGGYRLNAHFNCSSAAQAFNAAIASDDKQATWLVWVHQDVFLPEDWDRTFVHALGEAQAQFPKLAVVGVYGVVDTGNNARRAGHVLDRGCVLREPCALPCLVDSLDELLFAVRMDSGLRLDPNLGFDFYATDLVLQAQAAGLQSAVVEAYCEHWSLMPSKGMVSSQVTQRILASAKVFESKWAHRLPLTTPCFDIAREGDVKAFIDAVTFPAS
jgi:hypothetical protein